MAAPIPYDKQTWDTTSYVNPTRMNHIEDGIYNASIIPAVANSEKVEITPTSGSAYSPYGGCWYVKRGALVIMHLALSGLTAEQATQVWTLPNELKPLTLLGTAGTGGSINVQAFGQINPSYNSVRVWSKDA